MSQKLVALVILHCVDYIATRLCSKFVAFTCVKQVRTSRIIQKILLSLP